MYRAKTIYKRNYLLDKGKGNSNVYQKKDQVEIWYTDQLNTLRLMGGQKSNIAALEWSLVNCAPSKENYAFFIKKKLKK